MKTLLRKLILWALDDPEAEEYLKPVPSAGAESLAKYLGELAYRNWSLERHVHGQEFDDINEEASAHARVKNGIRTKLNEMKKELAE